MVFLIVFPSFILKKAAFLIGFNSFLLLFSYSFYLFYSFLMHYGCIFSQTLVELYDYSFFLCRLLSNFLLFTAFLCIIHLISLCFSLIIFIPSYLYLYRSTPVNRSFHSSGRFFSLQCTSLFTGVERYRYRQETGKTHYTLSLIFYTFILHQYCLFILLIRYLSFIYNII